MMSTQRDLCDLCGGELVPEKTSVELWHGEELLILRDIPAQVCVECGEAYFDPDVSERIDAFLETYHRCRPQRYIPVPEFTATQALRIPA